MADGEQTNEQRFARCREIIARQRANLVERDGCTAADTRWAELTTEFAALQLEFDRLLGATREEQASRPDR
jgi:ribosome biogenesis protein Tsr3